MGAAELQRRTNVEMFYKNVLLTKKFAVYCTLPFFACWHFYKRQVKSNEDMYKKYAAGLTDVELLRLECKLNPYRLVTYKYIFDQEDDVAAITQPD